MGVESPGDGGRPGSVFVAYLSARAERAADLVAQEFPADLFMVRAIEAASQGAGGERTAVQPDTIPADVAVAPAGRGVSPWRAGQRRERALVRSSSS